ncbi:CarboxypepD_reg-like domain-containing protein [bacterium A37T11]|nr:CarboxypepD_reg-like domain-containing protein [bacterium A37T11]
MKWLLVIPFLFFVNQLRAQDAARRQVSGIVKDSVGDPIPGANVTLVSAKDSLITRTDEKGHYLFSAVESAVFEVTVSCLGYRRKLTRYHYNNTEAKLELSPITLKAEVVALDEVQVQGKVGVVFKTDTVEFTASDYQVQKYDKVDELIKKMEGVEIDADGKVMFNGKEVKKARFNGCL